MKNEYINELIKEFSRAANPEIAEKQSAYLKNKFECYGLMTAERRDIQKPFLAKTFLPPKDEAFKLIKTLWNKPQREFHYFAQELAYKYKKQAEPTDIELFEFLITNQSWWDTVDMIATKLVSNYFIHFPEKQAQYIQKWLDSGHLWLKRTAIIYQLPYKEKTDLKLLEYAINQQLGSKEFFTNKAIGWALRDYSRIGPDWVIQMTEKYPLSNLSKREALRLIKAQR